VVFVVRASTAIPSKIVRRHQVARMEIETNTSIPESLLSLAKDARCIRQCQVLLEQAIESASFLFWGRQILLSTSGSSPSSSNPRIAEDDGGDDSTIPSGSDQITFKRRMWLVSFMLYGLLVMIPNGRTLGMQICGLKFDVDRQANNNKSDRHYRKYISIPLPYRLMAYMLLTLGGGWTLDQLASTKKRRNDTPTSMSSNESLNSRGSNGSTSLSNGDRLRGRGRRELHQRLRRQMLERSRRGDGSMEETNSSYDPLLNDNNDYHGHRPNNLEDSSSAPNQSRRRRRWSVDLRQVSNSLLDALVWTEGPHETMNASQDLTGDVNTYCMAIWMVRLHLAHFLITGSFYTSWIHRILGLKSVEQKSRAESVIAIRTNSRPIIASLILLQASTSLLRWLWTGTAQRAAAFLENRRERRMIPLISPINSSIILNPAKVRRQQFEQAMVHYFESRHSSDGHDPVRRLDAKENILVEVDRSSISDSICTICRTERDIPAASVNCGHVCCWDCMLHWVTNVRPECPLCRTPCLPQEIMILHGYK
jgi:Zinc finger, C3HC4 type (RING finger)